MKLDDISEAVLSPKLFFPISAKLKKHLAGETCSQESLVGFAEIFITFCLLNHWYLFSMVG